MVKENQVDVGGENYGGAASVDTYSRYSEEQRGLAFGRPLLFCPVIIP